jgi:hypothetical protein
VLDGVLETEGSPYTDPSVSHVAKSATLDIS